MKSQLTGKDPDAGEDWRQKEKGMTEDEMAGWHHWLTANSAQLTLHKLTLSKLWEVVKDREVWSAAIHGVAKESELLSNNNKMNSTHFNF